MRKLCGFIWRIYYNNFRLSRSDLTFVRCHVAVNFQGVSTVLRVDPVPPVSFRVTRVPDALTGISRLLGIPALFCCSGKYNKSLYVVNISSAVKQLQNQIQTQTSVTNEFQIFFLRSPDENDQFAFSCSWGNLGKKPKKKWETLNNRGDL